MPAANPLRVPLESAALYPLPHAKKTRWLELDGLRGLAVLYVIIFHFFSEVTSQPFLSAIVGNGWSGVDLFFVLSGFLVGGILLDQRSSASYYRTFYLRRACRILPLYALMTTVLLLGLKTLESRNPSLSTPAWPYLFMLQDVFYWITGTFGPLGLSVTWSLAIEEKFYFIMPFVIRGLQIKNIRRFLYCALCVCVLLRLMLYSSDSSPVLVRTVIRGDGLFMGVLLALWHRTRVRPLEPVQRYLLWGTAAVIGLHFFSPWAHGYIPPFVEKSLLCAEISVFYTILTVLSLNHSTGPWTAFLRLAPLRWVGKVSYCIYLSHDLIFNLVLIARKHFFPAFGQFSCGCVALVATLLFASLTWALFEQRFILLGHRFLYLPENRRAS